jgi:hypothetical protein
MGCDYSQIQFTKAVEFPDKPWLSRFFWDTNALIEQKPPFKNAVSNKLKRDVVKDFSYVNKQNAAVNVEKIVTDNVDFSLTDDDIKTAITKLGIDQQKYKDYIGMFFCEENFCKTNEKGRMSIVFFRVNDLSPILIKRFNFKPEKKFGFLFYWNSVNLLALNSLKEIAAELK